ncbi:MAG: SIS domain-containing protein [Candidatus Cloacimonetes bacterium]|nr:SIS domain-containing protein [Candidatus Cloacimonadota bacterium]
MKKKLTIVLYRLIDLIDRFKIPIPIFGIGCGVLGLSIVKVSPKLGEYASLLLKSLEYRGYDSTGAVFQDDKKNIVSMKDVGAPSTLIETLQINKQQGKIFCGQVRWATFGKVDKINAQPHEVHCKVHLYGAHNGNITNTPQLKTFLLHQGHKILSDNDGETLVHTIEHYFDIELERRSPDKKVDIETRKKCLRQAIISASEAMIGSYAAVIVDPVTEMTYGIKSGSSLYFGIGTIEGDNRFSLVSSDLTAILKFTKYLVDMKEGSFVEFNGDSYKIYAFKDLMFKKLNQPNLQYSKGDIIDTKPVRSKLRVEDTELLPEFEYFMEQEIHAEVDTTGRLIKIINGGSNTGRRMIAFLRKYKMQSLFEKLTEDILGEEKFDNQQKLFDLFISNKLSDNFLKKIIEHYTAIYDELVKEDFEKKYFFSSEKNVFIDLIGKEFDKKRILVSKALDSVTEHNDHKSFETKIQEFTSLVGKTLESSRTIYTMSCGTSFHATKVGAMFFNEIAGVEIIPVLPGEFRGQYNKCLQNNDVVIGVSQSGETKDLIDIFNDIDNMPININKIVLVNNINSTLGQEKSDVSIPIYCGQEIAVPATKSFINQITLFYYLAIRTAAKKLDMIEEGKLNSEKANLSYKNFEKYRKFFRDIPLLIKETIESTKDQIDFVAGKIYLEPSIHILATKLVGVAKEGALKVRETVLNHTEGQEGSEFKHGPNTILGKNTIYGLKNIKAMTKYTDKISDQVEILGIKRKIPYEVRREVTKALMKYIFDKTFPFHFSKEATDLFKEIVQEFNVFDSLFRNYPIAYITGPEERDVNLTISQINTHKIRGADTFIIAEENEKLMENAMKNPNSDGSYYGCGYIILPKTGDTLMTTFSATIVLQLLALKMSIRKMQYLDRLGMLDHGVHPDVPKNVSKSITVD